MRFVASPCRFTFTLPQYEQAAGRVSGKVLTCGSVNLTLGIGVRRGGLVLVSLVTETLPSFSSGFFPHRLWDGYPVVGRG